MMRFPQGMIIPVLAALCCALALAPAGAAAAPSRGTAALVNGAVLTGADFRDELKRVERLSARNRQKTGQAERAVAKKQVLENLIVRELLYQEAKKRGIAVPEAAVAAQLAELKGQLAGETEFADTIEQMGLSEAAIKAKLERGLAIRRLIDGTSARQGTVSEAQVAAYYEEHPDEFRQPLRLRLSHILIKTGLSGDAQQHAEGRARLEAIRRRLLAGEDFTALALESSECYSRRKGGDLGFFLPGQLSKRMEDEARALRAGEVSGIVEDRYGFHLLKVTELEPASVLPLEQVKPALRARLRDEQALRALAPLVKELRAAARVEILLNEDEP